MATVNKAKDQPVATSPDISKLSFAELQKLLAEAQSAIDTKKAEEIKVLADGFAKKLEAAGFTVEEGIAALKPYSATKQAKQPRADKGGHAPAKYRGPAGEEWSGRGQPPKWMKPLLAAGKKKEDFLIATA